MRVVVTGSEGQLARALRERAVASGVTIVCVARPQVDFERPETIGPAVRAARPDVVVNAAAYTMVDIAEVEQARATRINADAAGEVAAGAAACGAPIIQISTDYVFDGSSGRPYVETDAPAPATAYGRSKLAGERAVAQATDNHVILRTAWVHSPFGKNFVRTMLAIGLTCDAVDVVADQIGNPTYAPDAADGILRVAQALIRSPREMELRGLFHIVGGGDATWADLAKATFRAAEAFGRGPVAVRGVPSAQYPTPARRPVNSRLDCAKLLRTYAIALPDWRHSLDLCVARLLGGEAKG